MIHGRFNPLSKLLAATAVIAALAAASPAHAQYNVFVNAMPWIEGGSTDSRHKGQMEALAFAWNVASGATATASSTGTFSGQRATFSPFMITKTIDKASVPLAMAAAMGQVLPVVIIEIAKSDGDKSPIATFKLSSVQIESLSQSGAGVSGGPVTEEVAFLFTRIEITYYKYDSAGRPAGTTQQGWDLAANRRL